MTSTFSSMPCSRAQREQTHRRFVERFVAETKSSVMHRHQRFRTQFVEGFDRFLGIHVDFATGRRVVSADRQKRDIDIVVFADFPEAGKVSAVAAMKNVAAINLKERIRRSRGASRQENARPNGNRA